MNAPTLNYNQLFSHVENIFYISMTYCLPNKVFLCSKFRECSDRYIIRDKTMVQQLKCLLLQCDKSFSGGTTDLHQQNPFLTSGIIFVTIPYCTIYYLLYQDYVCAYPQSIIGFLKVSAIP